MTVTKYVQDDTYLWLCTQWKNMTHRELSPTQISVVMMDDTRRKSPTGSDGRPTHRSPYELCLMLQYSRADQPTVVSILSYTALS